MGLNVFLNKEKLRIQMVNDNPSEHRDTLHEALNAWEYIIFTDSVCRKRNTYSPAGPIFCMGEAIFFCSLSRAWTRDPPLSRYFLIDKDYLHHPPSFFFGNIYWGWPIHTYMYHFVKWRSIFVVILVMACSAFFVPYEGAYCFVFDAFLFASELIVRRVHLTLRDV